MDGLECNEVMLSKAKEYDPFRIDSHFYMKEYKELKKILSKFNCVNLKELVSKTIQTGHTPSMNHPAYYDGEIAFIKTDNVHNNHITQNFSDYLSISGNSLISRTELRARDIITTIIGATDQVIARSALVTEDLLPANINQNIVQIRIDINKVSPEYVNTFLNSKYGKQYLIYLSRQTEQFNLNCKEIEIIPVPILSTDFQQTIQELIEKAQALRLNSARLYDLIEQKLLSELEYNSHELSDENIKIKNISLSFGKTGRLDAEYYQQKYEDITNILNTTETVEKLCNIYDKNYAPFSNSEYQYIELADVGLNGEIDGVESICGFDLPTRARRIVKTGQVIISSIEGSLQCCALIPDEYNNALCSTGFYVIDSDVMNSETLLLLFKSEPIQLLMKQRCSGTILTGISKNEFLKMPLPHIDDDIQEFIAEKVRKSFELRKQSQHLIDIAVHTVEIAIESGEKTAYKWLETRVD